MRFFITTRPPPDRIEARATEEALAREAYVGVVTRGKDEKETQRSKSRLRRLVGPGSGDLEQVAHPAGTRGVGIVVTCGRRREPSTRFTVHPAT